MRPGHIEAERAERGACGALLHRACSGWGCSFGSRRQTPSSAATPTSSLTLWEQSDGAFAPRTGRSLAPTSPSRSRARIADVEAAEGARPAALRAAPSSIFGEDRPAPRRGSATSRRPQFLHRPTTASAWRSTPATGRGAARRRAARRGPDVEGSSDALPRGPARRPAPRGRRRPGRAAHRRGHARGAARKPARAFLAQPAAAALLAAADADGRVWATPLHGEPASRAPSGRTCSRSTRCRTATIRSRVSSAPDRCPPGCWPSSPRRRRRMRVNGVVVPSGDGLRFDAEQVFSNCPKYIARREPAGPRAPPAARSPRPAGRSRPAISRSSAAPPRGNRRASAGVRGRRPPPGPVRSCRPPAGPAAGHPRSRCRGGRFRTAASKLAANDGLAVTSAAADSSAGRSVTSSG